MFKNHFTRSALLAASIYIFSVSTTAAGLSNKAMSYLDTTTKATLLQEPLHKQDGLDKFYSSKRMGSFVENGKSFFRLFAPRAEKVILCITPPPNFDSSEEIIMTKDTDGVWDISLDGERYGMFYGFRVYNPEDAGKLVPICFDPYARALVSFNTYLTPRRSIVVKENDYNWEGDTWVKRDWRDIITYEMHIRDMTAHPSSMAKEPGTYQGLVEKGLVGGIDYIKALGVNTVELLPSQEFANYEIPYKDSLGNRFNNWNPYEKNYWGYMTAGFFAPETYFSEGEKGIEKNTWSGTSTKPIKDFKDMVKAFHKEGIAVIMDVVYNHFSEYESSGLKQIDLKYYFRMNDDGTLKAESYCGNDFKTERPMARKMIVESILYWMKEYHVDGFRFDLGKLIDWQTIEEIIREAKKINPSVVFVCEPWGGGYDPNGFSVRGWGAWNDQIRNGIKGENPKDGLGWIFGRWYGNNNINRIKSYVQGTLTRDSLGLFVNKETSVNYLESHDGYTLGDFIRVGTKEFKTDQIVKDALKVVKLSPYQEKLNKLAALFLLTSQGMTMINSGQEFARTKIIPYDAKEPDPDKGKLDHNTYNKDNSVNYIDYRATAINESLVAYYKGLIKLRVKFDAFRKADYENIEFIEDKTNPFALAYTIKHNKDLFFVAFNASDKEQIFKLPVGGWDVLVNDEKSGVVAISSANGKILLNPTSGMVLIKRM